MGHPHVAHRFIELAEGSHINRTTGHPLLGSAGPWVAHQSPTGHPWLTHEFVVLVHGLPMNRPWVCSTGSSAAHGSSICLQYRPMGRPWVCGVGMDRPWDTYGSYSIGMAHGSAIGHPSVCSTGPWVAHGPSKGLQYWSIGHQWIAHGFAILVHESPIHHSWVCSVGPWVTHPF